MPRLFRERPVYSAKTLAGLIALIRGGVFGPGQRVAFFHTGGMPAIFGYEDALLPYIRART